MGSNPIRVVLIWQSAKYAAVAELADAQDLKSCGTNLPYRFDSGRRHYYLEDPFFQLDIEVGSFFDKENVYVW